MTQAEITNVFPIHDTNANILDMIKANKNADPVLINHIIQHLEGQFERLDEGFSFRPYDDTQELWLWSPQGKLDVNKMFGLYVDLDLSGGKIKRTQADCMLGKTACYVVIFKSSCGCCPESNIMIVDNRDGELKYGLRYSQRSEKTHGNFFDLGVEHDKDGTLISEAYNMLEQQKPSQTSIPAFLRRKK